MTAGNDPAWTILRLLEWTRRFFESKGIDDPRLEAELLLAHVLKVERIQLYVQHARTVAEPELSAFRDLVRRRAARVPTQYLLGEAHFRHLVLKVTPAVLIPRPETELLVDEALAVLRPRRQPAWAYRDGRFVDRRDAQAGERVDGGAPPAPAEPRVLDLCTGSGCVALAIASECPSARVTATDLSRDALAVARENAARCLAADRVTWLEGDLFAPLALLPPQDRIFDLITANPPYVRDADMAGLMPEVRDHEPHMALAAGPDGMKVIDRILAGAAAHLADGGHLLMEIGHDQADRLRERLSTGVAAGMELLEIRKDLSGHPRIAHLRRSP